MLGEPLSNAELAILSLIHEAPRHGYELEQLIQARNMRDWTEIGFSSIYRILKQLEAKGMVKGKTGEKQGRGPARTRYQITTTGETAFIGASLSALSDPKKCYSSFLIGLDNLMALPGAAAVEALQTQRDNISLVRDQLQASGENHPDRNFYLDAFFNYLITLHNAEIGIGLLDAIIGQRGLLDLSQGARKLARRLARTHGQKVLDGFLYTAYARKGWMVPNQYWTPGVLSPMTIMGKYYMYYGNEFIPPRELGRKNAERMTKELVLDNLGFCRFHRGWAEEMMPDVVGSLVDMKEEFLASIEITASRISSRNSSVFWESERNVDYVHTFLKRERDVEGNTDPELLKWLDAFQKDRREASLSYWYEMHKGVHESLREF